MCGEPPYVSNSRGNAKSVHNAFPGHSLVYQCATGYRLQGSPDVTCEETGHWSTQPRCDVITCPTLPPSQNPMLMTTNGSVFSSVAEYRCITGYTLVGRGLLQCQETGKWDNPLPTCSIVECGPPPEVAFATSTSDGQTYGSSTWYTCREGYEADTTVVNCKAHGHWEPSPPVCRRISCPPPPMINNGSMHGDDFSFTGIVRYECDEGHTREGNVTIVCGSNGRWSSSPPVCQPVRCGTPPVFSTHVGETTSVGILLSYGMRYRYHCREGFVYEGEDHELTCGVNGTWEGILSDCVPISCGPPKQIPHSLQIGHDYSFNQTISYECDTGFRKTGIAEIVCMAIGQWTNTSLACEIVTCAEPPRVSNADSSNERVYNQTVKYTCHSGYLINGSAELLCDGEGNWIGQAPTCDPVVCGPPRPPEHGIINTSSWTYRSLGYIYCAEGYDFYGNVTVECQSNGNWSNTTGTCLPRSCGELSAVENGQVIYDGITFGSFAEYFCLEGHTLEGIQAYRNNDRIAILYG